MHFRLLGPLEVFDQDRSFGPGATKHVALMLRAGSAPGDGPVDVLAPDVGAGA